MLVTLISQMAVQLVPRCTTICSPTANMHNHPTHVIATALTFQEAPDGCIEAVGRAVHLPLSSIGEDVGPAWTASSDAGWGGAGVAKTITATCCTNRWGMSKQHTQNTSSLGVIICWLQPAQSADYVQSCCGYNNT